MLNLKDFRSVTQGLNDLLPWAALIEPGIVLQKDGSLLSCWEARGKDADSLSADEKTYISERVNASTLTLGTGWMLHVDAVRMPEVSYPAQGASHFPDRVSAMIDGERRSLFSGGNFYSTRTVLTVTYKPPLFADKLVTIAVDSERSNALEKSLETFRAGSREFEVAFSTVLSLTRLESYTEEDEFGLNHEYSPLLSFLQLCVSGEEYPIIVPSFCPAYLDVLLGNRDLVGGLSPRIGDKHIAVIGLDGLPQESYPSMLSVLDMLPMAYRFSTRFICFSQFEALQEIDKFRKTWRQQTFKFFDQLFNKPNARANRDAVRMTEDAEEAYADVQSGLVSSGFHTANIVLLHENAEVLEDWCQSLRRALQALGFGARLERVNALEAWLGTHPGNWYANVRRPLLNTLNLSHLLPLSTVWPGRAEAPCPFYPPGSPPLMYCVTDGTTPFRLNLHVGDLGHTLIFGPTGAGKSTLLGIIAAQFRRYRKGSLFVFDKGNSMYALCKAVGGVHLDIAGESSPSFCPLQNIDDENELSWAAEWLASLCELQGLKLLARHRAAIFEGLKQAAENPPEMRSLTDFIHIVHDEDVKRYLAHYSIEGAMGRLLDAQEDRLSMRDFMVFEIETLMNRGNENLIPTLTYIFHRIEQSLTGQPALLILDEAWVMLGHEVFRGKIREWLKVLRKANCAVVLATQNLSDARRSGIFDVLVDSCPTKILLPNHEARNETQYELYKGLDLNDRQIEIVATSVPKRDYYVMSSEGRRLVQLALGPKTLAFVGVSDKESVAEVKRLEKEHGPDGWVDVWLEERGAAL
ncbi:MAG: conjugal transfer protein TrbE [Desulfovibrio sp.]|jgi:type IV secretion system protein VirB4|nr:conjugal transfer protein TrbE [Desulfovibrio sp.]